MIEINGEKYIEIKEAARLIGYKSPLTTACMMSSNLAIPIAFREDLFFMPLTLAEIARDKRASGYKNIDWASAVVEYEISKKEKRNERK